MMQLLPRRARLLLGGAVVLMLAVAGFALTSLPNDGMGGRATDATGTIARRMDTGTGRFADVRFTTATGAVAVATVEICHHQSYDIGNALAIRYDAAHPANAYEKDMAPTGSPVGPFAFMLAFGLAVVMLAQHRAAKRSGAVPAALPLDVPDLDRELEQLLSAYALAPDAEPDLVDA